MSVVHVAGTAVPIQWRKNPKARRYILRFKRPACVVATIPRGGSQNEALAFIVRSQAWLERQLAKPVVTEDAWTTGTEIWLRGTKVSLGQMGFDGSDLRQRAVRHLRSLAAHFLSQRTRELAAQTGSVISRISIRDQRTRWGSCSVRGCISLNWRLIQTPEFVTDYIILHELMHLRQMNHSEKFWREVESVCPAWRDAEKWIRQHGREIMPG